LTNQHRWVRRVVSAGLLVGMIYHSARSQQRGELQASTQTALSPSATTATVLVDSYCTWTSYNNNIPVVHYVTDNAVNGRYDNFALDNQPSAPPGFSISFSVATTTGPNVVYASVPMSIDPASPVGYYAAAIVADATTSSPHSCLNGSGQGNQQIAAYFGTVNYTVNAISSAAIRTSFSSFTTTASPATAISDATDYTWDGPGTATWNVSIGSGVTGFDPIAQAGEVDSCIDGSNAHVVAVCPPVVVSPQNGPPGVTSVTFQMQPPSNPSPGNYTPGQLGLVDYGASYEDSGGVLHFLGTPPSYSAAMGAAGTTYYITADEETFSLPPNCETYRGRLNGQPYTYQGSQPGSVVFPQSGICKCTVL
jgi:hypothetical protein